MVNQGVCWALCSPQWQMRFRQENRRHPRDCVTSSESRCPGVTPEEEILTLLPDMQSSPSVWPFQGFKTQGPKISEYIEVHLPNHSRLRDDKHRTVESPGVLPDLELPQMPQVWNGALGHLMALALPPLTASHSLRGGPNPQPVQGNLCPAALGVECNKY